MGAETRRGNQQSCAGAGDVTQRSHCLLVGFANSSVDLQKLSATSCPRRGRISLTPLRSRIECAPIFSSAMQKSSPALRTWLARSLVKLGSGGGSKDGRGHRWLQPSRSTRERWGPPAKLAQPGTSRSSPTLDARIEMACKTHEDFVRKENHGVRERNLMRILLPIGVRESDLDPVWVGEMETFGIGRGVIAMSQHGL